MKWRSILSSPGRAASRVSFTIVCFTLASSTPVFGQETSIAGVVRDVSGGVLPGVTVEASSPALIEKSRSALTDGSGQYRILALVPGVYTVTFSLDGFSRVERTGIELRAETILPVNAEMKPGALQETVTVTGASPVVDLQTVSSVTVMTREILDVAPISKNLQTVGILIPGTSLQGSAQAVTRDVGGSSQGDQYPLSYRGSTASVTSVDGMRVSVVVASGQYGLFQNDGGAQEISYNTGADSAEMGQAGLRINVVPREGGNTFRGTISGNFTGGDAWNAYNLSDALQARGITSVSRIRHVYDFNPVFGGPIRRDRFWFLTTARWLGVTKTATDTYYDADPTPWKYAPDTSREGFDDSRQTSFLNRLTWRVTESNKVTGYIDKQTKYIGHIAVSSTNAPEAASCQCLPYQWVGNVKWTSTLSPRLLLESGWGIYNVEWDYENQPDVPLTAFRINDQPTGRNFAAPASQQRNISSLHSYTTKLSWVTGRHTLSGGLNGSLGSYRVVTTRGNGDVSSMRYSNIGVGAPGADASGYGPNQVTLNLPTDNYNKIDGDNGFWVTDRMTYGRATITAGLRLDWFIGSVGDSAILPNTWTESATYEGFGGTPSWHDLSPRLGFAYDLFGNGKTALKLGASKYLNAETVSTASSVNPINTLTGNISLTWTDNNGDHTIFNPDGTVQDKDMKNGNPTQDELAPIPASSTFGKLVPSTTITDPRVRDGFGVRGYSWEFSGGIQHELLPRVSVNFNYYYRPTAGNQVITDNVNVGPSNYIGPYCLTVPTDPRLPQGGGWQLCDIYQLAPAAFSIPTQNVQTFTETHLENAGSSLKPIVYNHGYDLTVSARTGRGTTIQGGINADQSISDNCYLAVLASPQTTQINPMTGERYCHTVTPFRPDVKFIAAQSLPWGMQLSGTYQRTPGPARQANWTITQAVANQNGWTITTAPGSTPAQIAAATATFNLMQTGQQYEEPLNQIDLRFTKYVNLAGGKRLQLNVDLYNALNSAWVYTQNNTLGTNTIASTWLRPAQILQARMFKIGGQFDF
jgi:hypothetical protein